MLEIPEDESFMEMALQQAHLAFEQGEIPVGAVLVCKRRIIGKGYNQTIALNDPTAHAEMIAITSGCEHLGSRYLNECTLYVTLEPCSMCLGATFWSNLGRIVYGADDPKRGGISNTPQILHPRTNVTSGVLAEECQDLLTAFFKGLRKW